MEELAVTPHTPLPTGAICCDVDGVLVTGNTHNLLLDAIEKDPTLKDNHEAQWEIIAHHPDVKLINDADRWKNIILKAIGLNIPFSFVSYSNYGLHIIPRILQHWVGLDAETIKKILVVSYLPSKTDQYFSGKNNHIAKTRQPTNTEHLPANRIVLIEDNKQHIDRAKPVGYQTINVLEDKNYLGTLESLMDEELCKPIPLTHDVGKKPVLTKEKSRAFYLSSSSESDEDMAPEKSPKTGTPLSSPRVLYDSPILSGQRSPLRRSPFSGANSPLTGSREKIDNDALSRSRESPGVK